MEMKRTFSLSRSSGLVLSGTALVAVTYGLVRLAYGLFLPDVQAELGLDDATAGLVSSGASVLYCAGALTGFLLAATRPRLLVVLAAVTAGGGALGTALSGGVASFGLAAVVSSAGAGLASPALVTLVHRGVAAHREGRAQATVNSGTGPGLALAGLLALVLLPDWRTGWAVAALSAAVAATAVLLLDRHPSRRASRQEARPAPSRPARPTLPSRTWALAHLVVVVAAGLLGAGSAAVWTYGRTLLVAAGTSPTVSVVAWIALGLGGATVAVTARWTSALRPRVAWAATAGAVALATLLLTVAPAVPSLALAACVLFGWGYTAATGALIAWTNDIDPEQAAPGTSMAFVVLVLGQALGAAGAGALVGVAGLPATFVVAAAVTAAGVAVTARRPGRPRA
ncbi:MFS transporter [Frigoribacterium salinisoli]